ncbi:MAG TPA: DUF4268 domain-containing protein [Bacteroidia bacterium]|nr:DUF4268 domain-containing protein [Bacteroidia bacterium]HNU33640.1 DUF4268 domain-containing protein [Bacteroidia bacterium]
MNLGKLEKVELRSVWKNEGIHFTPWLALEQNISLLSETIDIDLEVQAQEERVGPFRADILCKDTVSDRFVLIENQFEYTDHKHLGQLMTYAAGLNAVTIIWIAEKFTEEHRAALDWLNRITDDSVDFFGIEIELYRIGGSAPAPKFNVISKPNNWAKNIKRNAENSELTETKLLQQEYWQALKEYVSTEKVSFRLQKPLPQHWTNIAIGRSHFHLTAFANTRDSKIGVILIVSGPNALDNFRALREKYESESKEVIGNTIEWIEKDGGKEHHVNFTHSNCAPLNKADWKRQHALLKETIQKSVTFFKDKVQSI